MYKTRYIQYLNLPPVPDSILNNLSLDFNHYEKTLITGPNADNYWWSDTGNTELNKWAQENICAEMYFAFFHVTDNGLYIHKDRGTKTKLNFIVELGGDNVITNFYDDDQKTIVDSHKIEARKWHILKADSYHSVSGIDPNKFRFVISGRVF